MRALLKRFPVDHPLATSKGDLHITQVDQNSPQNFLKNKHKRPTVFAVTTLILPHRSNSSRWTARHCRSHDPKHRLIQGALNARTWMIRHLVVYSCNQTETGTGAELTFVGLRLVSSHDGFGSGCGPVK